jgi:hypothetical protein
VNTTQVPLSPQRGRDQAAESLCSRRLIGFLAFGVFLTVAFIRPLTALAAYAAETDLHSHILLVPFISAYLIYIRRRQLPKEYLSSW